MRMPAVGKQVNDLLKNYNGIGQSKLQSRKESSTSYKSLSGHQVSNNFHSYKSMDNARSCITNLGKFAKKELRIKDITKIDRATIERYVEHQIAKGVTYKSISNEISIISKISGSMDFNRNDLKEIRDHANKNAERSVEKTRSYRHLDKTDLLLSENLRPAFMLQRDYGLRLKEATHINIDRFLNGNMITVTGKGGKIIEREISQNMIDALKKHANENGLYKVSQSTYSKNLRSALEEQGNQWNGTHGLRHSYAQKRMLEDGATKAEVSAEMGHVRESITDVYLR